MKKKCEKNEVKKQNVKRLKKNENIKFERILF